jgi:hypothetical protein
METGITRTFRAAIRIGEDFVTIEETITLPLDADADQIAQAVDFGWRIYAAQREASLAQVAEIRQGAPTAAPAGNGASYTGGAFDAVSDMPATMKQRNYIATLQDKLGWSNEQLAVFARERGVDLVDMTKPQVSTMIEEMKRLADSPRPSRPADQPVVPMFSDDDLPF